MLGFFILVKRFSKIVKNSKTMQLSTKTTNPIFSLPQIAQLFGGNFMVNNCRFFAMNRSQVSDYKVIKKSCDFIKRTIQRVKEIKCVFV